MSQTSISPAPLHDRHVLIGLSLSATIILAAVAMHLTVLYGISMTPAVWVAAPLLIAGQSWLFVGLFIVSHDAIHGSIAPGRPGVNRAFGRVAMMLYAGFPFDVMSAAHHRHHDAPGTAADPDFHVADPGRAVPWFRSFIGQYFGLRPLLFVNGVVAIHWLIFGVPLAQIALFYGLPAIMSAVQLFFFGTFLPHRHEESPFADRHNARSTRFGYLSSLFSCYHFGYHHEHHLYPYLPWWQLPQARADQETLR